MLRIPGHLFRPIGAAAGILTVCATSLWLPDPVIRTVLIALELLAIYGILRSSRFLAWVERPGAAAEAASAGPEAATEAPPGPEPKPTQRAQADESAVPPFAEFVATAARLANASPGGNRGANAAPGASPAATAPRAARSPQAAGGPPSSGRQPAGSERLTRGGAARASAGPNGSAADPKGSPDQRRFIALRRLTDQYLREVRRMNLVAVWARERSIPGRQALEEIRQIEQRMRTLTERMKFVAGVVASRDD